MSQSEMIGKVVAHYRVDKVLGEGGMGAVYLATDLNLQRQVALKIMHPHLSAQDQFQKRFLQEARAAASLDHPGIVRILSFDHTDGVLILVMELVSAGSLRDYIKEQRDQGKLIDISAAVDFTRQIADALHYAHQQGMTHRDIKPDNILLKKDENAVSGYRTLITDFGLAKLAESNVHSMSGVPMGTFAYMSPEQAEAEKVDNRADIYALGIMLYELTVGKLPYQPRSITEAIRMHSREPLPKPSEQRPGFPTDLERAIIKATQKNPNDRYQTASDFSRELGRLKDSKGSSSGASEPARPEPVQERQPTYVVNNPPPAAPPGTPPAAPPPISPSEAGFDRLIITGTDGQTRSMALSKDVYIIGRDDDRDVVLTGSSKVSRSHARLERSFDGKYRLIDLGSTNGTFVNEQRLPANAPEAIAPGQQFRIGDYWLQIEQANRSVANQMAQMSFTQLENQAAAAQQPPPPQPAPQQQPYQPPQPSQPPQSYPPQPQPYQPSQPYTPAQQPSYPPQPQPYTPGGSYTPAPSGGGYTPPPAGSGFTPPPANPYGSAVYSPQGSQYGGQGSYAGAQGNAPYTDREQIILTLNQTQVRVDAGSSMTMTLEVENDSDLVDHFTIQVIGLDEDWYQPPPQTLYLMPKTRDTAQITFKPPRKPSSKAGSHPFEVRATARAQGLQSAAKQATLIINPYQNYISAIEPQRIKKRKGRVDLTIENRGNTFATFDISARDREELLNYKLGKKQFVLQPGEKEHIPIDISAKKFILLGQASSTGFEVSVKPQEEGSASQLHNGDLVNPALLPMWLLGLFGLSLMGLVALAVTAVQKLIIEPPNLTSTVVLMQATQTSMFLQTGTPIALTMTAEADSDGDGLTNLQEATVGTDPILPDTDRDGLTDGEEVNVYETNPRNRDSDADGLTDGDEINQYGSNPANEDSDGDGLKDGQEVTQYQTNPNVFDTDRDGYSDGQEVTELGTDPLTPNQATATPQPTVDPAVGCVGGLTPRLRVDMFAVVTADGSPLRIRSDPRVEDGNVLSQMNEGTRMRVVGGPVCDDDDQLTWWQIQAPNQPSGWAAESRRSPDEYYIAPEGAEDTAPAGG